MWDYSADEVVWYDLGPSYGWWPCQVQDSSQPATMSPYILSHLGTHFSHTLRWVVSSEKLVVSSEKLVVSSE